MQDWLRNTALRYLINRLKEPSTWAGLLAAQWVTAHFDPSQIAAINGLAGAFVAAALTFLPNSLGGSKPEKESG
jgi:hypothetical protein